MPCESSAIPTFEESVVGTVRQWMRGLSDCGFKSLTHYEDGVLVVKGMIALARGVSLPSNRRSIPAVTIDVSPSLAASAFEEILAYTLRPTLTEGNGLLRADLMAAFGGGNHFRSLGIFYGHVSKKRQERRRQNLPLTLTFPQAGADSAEPQRAFTRLADHCPVCGTSATHSCDSIVTF